MSPLDPNKPMIQWRDVIQLDPSVSQSSPYLQMTIQALDTLQKSATGQDIFAQLAAAQRRVPETYDWPGYESVVRKGDIPLLSEDAIDVIRRRTSANDPQKLLLTLKDNTTETQSGAYYLDSHTIGIFFPTALNLPTPRIDPATQEKSAAPIPLDELLGHEIQHAIDVLEMFFNNGPEYTTPCREWRAVRTQNRYSTETHPQAPRAEAYTDPDFSLREALKNMGLLNKGPLKFDDPERMRMPFVDIAQKVKLAEGCGTPLTYEQVVENTRNLLIKYNFDMKDFSPKQLSDWIHTPAISALFSKPEPAASTSP